MKIMKWNQLVREITRTPGPIKVQLLLLTTLTLSSVTSTALQIYNQVRSTSDENILHSVESLEVGNAELRVRVTGKSTTEVLQNLNPMLNDWAKENFKREIISLHKTLGKVNYEETRQLFLNNVLTEALDDGTPAYYNSNILGRYMKKDYGEFVISG